MELNIVQIMIIVFLTGILVLCLYRLAWIGEGMEEDGACSTQSLFTTEASVKYEPF
jgi:hypothetical protein